MIAVCVTFDIAPGRLAAVLPLVRRQAQATLAAEPGCHRFDVCTDAAAARIFLYELYSDRAAFDLHLASDHFRAFDAAVAPEVAAKSVAVFGVVETAG